jgi:hypothetical protein
MGTPRGRFPVLGTCLEAGDGAPELYRKVREELRRKDRKGRLGIWMPVEGPASAGTTNFDEVLGGTTKQLAEKVEKGLSLGLSG